MNARRWLMVLALGSACFAAVPADPINVLFDTDMGGDCDDVGALFILHGAMERGEIRLLGTLGCISSDAIAPALDAINTWFGRPEIPVGTLKDPGLLPGPHYTQELANRFPHKFASGKDYPDAVALYRKHIPAANEIAAGKAWDALVPGPEGFQKKARLDMAGVATVLALRSEFGRPQKKLDDPAKYVDDTYYRRAMGLP